MPAVYPDRNIRKYLFPFFFGINLFLVLMLLAAPSQSRAEDKKLVKKINIVGNKRTKERVILKELTFGIGSKINYDDIRASRQNLLNLELFSEVVISESIPYPDGRIDIEVLVKEKWSILPLPVMSRTSDGEIRLGVKYEDFNLGGRNHYFVIKAYNKWANDFENELGGFYSGSIQARNFLKTSYTFFPEISRGKTLEETYSDGVLISQYENDIKEYKFNLSKELDHTEVGIMYSSRKSRFKFLSGEPQLYNDTSVNSIGTFVIFDKTNNLGRYVYEGYKLSFSISNSNKNIGSDVEATTYSASFAHFLSFYGRKNLAYQISATYIAGNTAKDLLASIGGSTSLRGYETGQFKGDRAIQLNTEYRFPLTERYWGGVTFLDGGYAWPEGDSVNAGDIKWSIGLGLRLFIKQLVKGVGRLDVAYNLSQKTFKGYMGVHHIF